MDKMTADELNKWLVEKAICYTFDKTYNRISSLRTQIFNEPDRFEYLKIELAKELFFLYTASNKGEYVGREFLLMLDALHMSIDEAKYILEHYDWENERILSDKEAKLRVFKAMIKYKGDDNIHMAGINGKYRELMKRLEEKGESELLKSFSLDIFDDREAGIQYYKSQILKDIRFLLIRMTSDEMRGEIDDLIKEIHKIRKKILSNYEPPAPFKGKEKKRLDKLINEAELKQLEEMADYEHSLEEEI